jgi:hypothetical protein
MPARSAHGARGQIRRPLEHDVGKTPALRALTKVLGERSVIARSELRQIRDFDRVTRFSAGHDLYSLSILS